MHSYQKLNIEEKITFFLINFLILNIKFYVLKKNNNLTLRILKQKSDTDISILTLKKRKDHELILPPLKIT